MNATPRKRAKRDSSKKLTLTDAPFRRLIEEDEALRKLRREYESLPAEERRKAALWEYESSLAKELFNEALRGTPGGAGFPVPEDAGPCPGAVLALAIDPSCPPVLLTVGSVEYQLGRVDEAMKLFLTLAALPTDTEDLPEIIDKAGDFLIDQEDYENASTLYASAARHDPEVVCYHDGLNYCAGKLGQHDRAVEHARRAVALEPENYMLLNDLGWAMLEAKSYDEAEKVLEMAVSCAPSDYERARNNLTEARRRRKMSQKRKNRK